MLATGSSFVESASSFSLAKLISSFSSWIELVSFLVPSKMMIGSLSTLIKLGFSSSSVAAMVRFTSSTLEELQSFLTFIKETAFGSSSLISFESSLSSIIELGSFSSLLAPWFWETFTPVEELKSSWKISSSLLTISLLSCSMWWKETLVVDSFFSVFLMKHFSWMYDSSNFWTTSLLSWEILENSVRLSVESFFASFSFNFSWTCPMTFSALITISSTTFSALAIFVSYSSAFILLSFSTSSAHTKPGLSLVSSFGVSSIKASWSFPACFSLIWSSGALSSQEIVLEFFREPSSFVMVLDSEVLTSALSLCFSTFSVCSLCMKRIFVSSSSFVVDSMLFSFLEANISLTSSDPGAISIILSSPTSSLCSTSLGNASCLPSASEILFTNASSTVISCWPHWFWSSFTSQSVLSCLSSDVGITLRIAPSSLLSSFSASSVSLDVSCCVPSSADILFKILSVWSFWQGSSSFFTVVSWSCLPSDVDMMLRIASPVWTSFFSSSIVSFPSSVWSTLSVLISCCLSLPSSCSLDCCGWREFCSLSSVSSSLSDTIAVTVATATATFDADVTYSAMTGSCPRTIFSCSLESTVSSPFFSVFPVFFSSLSAVFCRDCVVLNDSIFISWLSGLMVISLTSLGFSLMSSSWLSIEVECFEQTSSMSISLSTVTSSTPSILSASLMVVSCFSSNSEISLVTASSALTSLFWPFKVFSTTLAPVSTSETPASSLSETSCLSSDVKMVFRKASLTSVSSFWPFSSSPIGFTESSSLLSPLTTWTVPSSFLSSYLAVSSTFFLLLYSASLHVVSCFPSVIANVLINLSWASSPPCSFSWSWASCNGEVPSSSTSWMSPIVSISSMTASCVPPASEISFTNASLAFKLWPVSSSSAFWSMFSSPVSWEAFIETLSSETFARSIFGVSLDSSMFSLSDTSLHAVSCLPSTVDMLCRNASSLSCSFSSSLASGNSGLLSTTSSRMYPMSSNSSVTTSCLPSVFDISFKRVSSDLPIGAVSPSSLFWSMSLPSVSSEAFTDPFFSDTAASSSIGVSSNSSVTASCLSSLSDIIFTNASSDFTIGAVSISSAFWSIPSPLVFS